MSLSLTLDIRPVSQLFKALGLSQPNRSRQLDVLRRDVEKLLRIRGPGACR